MSFRKSCIALLVVAAVGRPSSLAAQEARTRADTSADSTRATRLDRVVITDQARASTAVGSRLGLDWRHMPASVSVVDQQGMQDLGRNTIVEAVRGLPGITSAMRPGAPGVFSSRGFVENGIGVLFDGVRVQSATVTMRTYDAFNFERVEVLRGPASVLYGEGAATGAVNFVRRKPQAGPLRIEALTQGGGGGLDQARLGVAATGSLGEHAELTASGSGNWFGTPYEGNRHEYRHAVAGVRLRPASRTAVLLEGDYLDNVVHNAYWGVPLVNDQIDESIRFRNYNRADDTRYSDRVAWGRISADQSLGDRATYTGQAFLYDGQRDWRNFYAFRYVPAAAAAAAGVERRFSENLAYDHHFSGTRHQLAFSTPTAGREIRTAIGGEITRTNFSSPRAYGARVIVGVDGPSTTANAALFPARADDRRARIDAAQLFAENRLDLVSGLTLVTGLNVDRVATDIARPASGAAFSRTFTPIAGRAGLVADLGAGHSVYAQYATGSEPVSALVILAPAESTFALTRTRQVEVGTKHALWGGRAAVTSALYRIERTNLVTSDASAPSTSVQIGAQSARGAEVTLAIQPTTAWHVEANAALVRARYDNFREGTDVRDGKRPPNVPARVANAGADYRVSRRLLVGAWVAHVGAAAADNSNAIDLPAYTLTDAYARVGLPRGVDLTARIKNLFDATYAEWATRSSGQTNVYFGYPRSFEVTLRVKP